MSAEPKRYHASPNAGGELEELLDDASERPVIIERDGVLFRLSRIEDSLPDYDADLARSVLEDTAGKLGGCRCRHAHCGSLRRSRARLTSNRPALMPYLLDTDWIIHALAGNRRVVSTIERLSGDRIFTSWFSVAELYEGAFGSPNPDARLQTFRRFLSGYRLIIPDDATAERFAEIRSALRRRGNLILDMDLLIAATALRHNLTLLTFNESHLSRIPDIQLFTT